MRPPRGRGFGRGGDRGGRGGGFAGRGGGRGFGGRGGGGYYDQGPPAEVVEAGLFQHPCEGEAVCKLTNSMVPYFNAPIFLENKTQVGKVDEIFGQINSVYFTVKMGDGIVATSYSKGDKFFIDPQKLLPLERFLPTTKAAGGARGGRGGGGGRGRGGFSGRGGGRGGGRGRGGGGFGGRGGGGRGGFGGRGGGGGRGGFRGRGRG